MERYIAYKLKIADLLSGKLLQQKNKVSVSVKDKEVCRVNIIANVVDKFVSNSNDVKYIFLLLDDATAQIRAKSFGDGCSVVESIGVGDTVRIIGKLRYFANELYIVPEIAKKVDPKWLLARKLELEKDRTKAGLQLPECSETTSQKTGLVLGSTENSTGPTEMAKTNTKDTALIEELAEIVLNKVVEMEKNNEEGADVEKLMLELDVPTENVKKAIDKLLEEAKVYEPKPGFLKKL